MRRTGIIIILSFIIGTTSRGAQCHSGYDPRNFGLRKPKSLNSNRFGFQIPPSKWYIGVYLTLSSLALQNSFFITFTPFARLFKFGIYGRAVAVSYPLVCIETLFNLRKSLSGFRRYFSFIIAYSLN